MSTHTFANLEVSHETYEEIAQAFRAIHYDHVFIRDRTGHLLIDMHGVALKDNSPQERTTDARNALQKYFSKRGGWTKQTIAQEDDLLTWLAQEGFKIVSRETLTDV
jgi:hypothetical protein